MFGFKEVIHKEYKNNFLRTVVFQLLFEKNDQLENKRSEIKELFKSSFPRFSTSKGKGFEISFNNENTNFQPMEEGYIISLKSEDGQKSIEINETTLSFTITGKAYKCFDNLNEELKNIVDFLKLCSIQSISRLALRKINIVEFKNDNNNPTDILTFLLNLDLVSQLNSYPNRNHINHCLQVLNYKDGNNHLNIKYGLIIPEQLNTEIGQLIIDIDLFKQELIDVDTIISNSNTINSEIFNIFNWLINDNTKKILNE